MSLRKTPESSGVFLWVEFLALFGGGPLLLLALRLPGLLFLALWAGGAVTYAASRAAVPAAVDGWAECARILRRFAVLAPMVVLATWVLLPAAFLELPLQRPVLWLAIMVLYPVLSVWPQEMIYRRFLMTRYERIFGRRGVVAGSALAFGFAHVIFLNALAVAMTVVGGAMFAADYARHQRLWLACFEHALYGCLVFTVGLGRFFYTGAAWHH